MTKIYTKYNNNNNNICKNKNYYCDNTNYYYYCKNKIIIIIIIIITIKILLSVNYISYERMILILYPDGKGGRWIWLTVLLSCADCLEIWESQPPVNLMASPGIFSHC